MVQWIRIPLSMQGTWVQSLVQEDSTCHETAKPMCLELYSATREAVAMRSLPAATREYPQSQKLGTAQAQQQRPIVSKNKRELCVPVLLYLYTEHMIGRLTL